MENKEISDSTLLKGGVYNFVYILLSKFPFYNPEERLVDHSPFSKILNVSLINILLFIFFSVIPCPHNAY